MKGGLNIPKSSTVENCIELLFSERSGHTLVIHSKDEDVIRQFTLKDLWVGCLLIYLLPLVVWVLQVIYFPL